MGTISSGMGLISGLDIESIVTQLMAIETRPRELLVSRIEKNTTQRSALMALQARVMALQVAGANFNKESVFQQRTVTSSDEAVLTATANQFTPLGNFQFTVRQLATTQNMISRGYAGLNSSLGTGTISIETQKAQIARPTDLSFINGQQGFYRGTLNITDRTGNDAQIDLSYALTLQDVIDAINNSTEVNVTASVSGDSLVITDNNVAPTGTMTITGSTAASLGIEGSTAAGASQIVGSDILYLTGETAFRQLNDGNGVRGFGFGDDLIFKSDGMDLFNVDLRDVLYREFGADDSADNSSTLRSLNGGAGIRLGEFRITDQNGRSVDIDLNELETIYGPNTTLGHLEEFIQTKIDEKNQQLNENYDPLDDATNFAGMMKMSLSFHGSDHLTITDNSVAFGSAVDSTERFSHFIIEDLDGGLAAADLGIADDVSGGNIHGEQIWRMETVGDIVNAVNNHWDNWDDTMVGDDKRLVSVALDTAGAGLTLSYQGAGTLTIDNTAAADDLGLANTQGVTGSFTGRRLIAGLNTVMLRSLNGGSAGTDQITSGSVINLTDRAGASASVDLTNAYTVQEVIDAINAAGTNIVASVNDKGNGMVLTDSSAPGGYIEVSGELAEKLNIAVTAAEAVGSVDSGNLQLQYINEGTALDELRQGSGIRRGKFTITDSTGRNWKIDLDQTRIENLQDVIDEINNQQVQVGGFGAGEDPVYQRITVRADMNTTGDGILLYDLAEDSDGNPITNPQLLRVIDEDGGHTAADLGLLKAAKQDAQGKYFIDGSYEYKFEMGGGDTIEDLVSRINKADIGLSASVINDGSESNPYRISFNGENTGRDGAMYLDAGTTNLTTHSLTEARDAVLLYGQPGQENPILITSSSNTVKDVIKGTTLELHSASNSAVSINIQDDIEGIVAQMTSFVEAYNSIMKDIAQLDSFNPDTLERGILFGDRTVDSIRRTLEAMVYRNVPGLSSALNGLNDVGIKFAPLGFETAPDENGQTRNYTIATTPKLEFDEEKFRAAYTQNPQGVAELFTKKDKGIGDYIAEQLNRLAASSESTISHRLNSMQSRQDNFEDRIESLDRLLGAKEARLYKQFYAMEQALASMQSQQSALGSLASLVASTQG
jgi:flagellar capping protein FliD